MRISFSPQRGAGALDVEKIGDVLTINGTEFDFSVIPDGADLPAQAVDCEFVIGTVRRVDGDLRLTLVLPLGATPSPALAFPSDLINPADGPLAIPFDPPAEEPTDE